MGLQSFIAERKKDKDLLVMAHVVLRSMSVRLA